MLPHGTKRRSKGIILTTRTRLKHPTKRTPPPPRCCFRGEPRRPFERTAWQRSRKEGCGLPAGVRSGWFHDAPEDRKPIRCSTCGQAISVLSEQGQVWARWQASTQTTIHVTRSSQATSTAPSSSSSPSPITPAPAPSLVPASSDGSERWSRPVLGFAPRPFEVALSGAAVTKGGNRRECASETEKGRGDGKGKCEGWCLSLEEGGRGSKEGRQRTGAGRACCSPVAWRLICSYGPPARV
jgi:hypothetical protein